LGKQLGKKGYAFAKIQVDKRVNELTKTVALKLIVLSGSRAYVRRINIKGNYRTRDDVYRREMRQLESSWYSKEAIERSKVRIQRLPYVESVRIAKTPVAGSRDQVDLEVTVKERLSNQFSIGAGFSQNQGFLFNASLKQENFMGTGKRLFLGIENSKSVKNYNVTYTNPYYTVDGISRGFTAYLNEFDGEEGLVSDYISNRYGGDIHYTIPLNETDSFRFSLGGEHREIETTSETPQHVRDFIAKNGDTYDQLLGTVAYTRDTRDRTIFPTKGLKQSLSLEMALPGSDLEYNKIRYNGAFYLGFLDHFIFAAKTKVAVGKGSGDADGLPFYQKFYGGGLRSVRGFKQNSLGPRDSNDKPKGGDLSTSASAELLFPAPFMVDNKSIRMSAFVDAGNVFEKTGDFDSSDLRYSAGIGMVWLSPVGPFSVSYAKPLNAKDGDEEQKFQFSLGAAF
jgi:outer membrane protein insertion porin family